MNQNKLNINKSLVVTVCRVCGNRRKFRQNGENSCNRSLRDFASFLTLMSISESSTDNRPPNPTMRDLISISHSPPAAPVIRRRRTAVKRDNDSSHSSWTTSHVVISSFASTVNSSVCEWRTDGPPAQLTSRPPWTTEGLGPSVLPGFFFRN